MEYRWRCAGRMLVSHSWSVCLYLMVRKGTSSESSGLRTTLSSTSMATHDWPLAYGPSWLRCQPRDDPKCNNHQ
jgi:hypothetical protein